MNKTPSPYKKEPRKISLDEAVSNFNDSLVTQRRNKIKAIADDEEYLSALNDIRKSYWTNNGFNDSKLRRHIASLPPEVYWEIIRRYGDDVFKDKSSFRDLFSSDEFLKLFLLVPSKTL